MDYRIVLSCCVIITLTGFPFSFAIVNRDLVLTPKQGLQLSGKRIFYDENAPGDGASLRNSRTGLERPWERTLKHVTYLTLFTNAANGIITGNFSKVKEYNDFLQSPYVLAPNPIDSRFGDIVTLAEGRLESMKNGSYRFVEGTCDYECARATYIVAMWHVQKIRHRDVDHKFHYEMKFSVSPITSNSLSETVVRGGPNKRKVSDNFSHRQENKLQTFIQKEDDYPLSFHKITKDSDADFAERRYDASRNFRHVPNAQPQHPGQVTPLPQSTFLRGVYRAPPPHLQPQAHVPSPDNLNIGEYYKGSYVPKASPKIELFPNLLTMMFGKPQAPNYGRPQSQYRPGDAYPVKHPRPEVYAPPPGTNPLPQILQHHSELVKLPEYYHGPEQLTAKVPQTAVVAHHYHHHYFMANVSDSGEQHFSGEQPEAFYKHHQVQEVTPLPHFVQIYDQTTLGHQPHHLHDLHLQQQHKLEPQMPPAPQKFVFPTTQIEPQRVVHITPVPPLKKPQYQPYYQQIPLSVRQGPIAVYAASGEEERPDVSTPRDNKPFAYSQPLDESTIRYSEPDPLYANVKEPDSTSYGTPEDQIDSNEHQVDAEEDYDQQIEPETTLAEDTADEHSDTVEAQVQAPNSNQNSKTVDTQETTTETEHRLEQLQQSTSHKATVTLSTEETTATTTATEAPNALPLAATTKANAPSARHKRVRLKVTKLPSAGVTSNSKQFSTKVTQEQQHISSTTIKPQHQFVSSPTTESPLKTLTRYRNSNKRLTTSTTSTEKPVLKWKPRQKETVAKALKLKDIAKTTHDEAEIKDSNGQASFKETTNFTVTPATLASTESEWKPTTPVTNDVTLSASTTLPTLLPPSSSTPSGMETAYEVLTQKSVSKSVEFTISANGQEIPIIINERANEVKTK